MIKPLILRFLILKGAPQSFQMILDALGSENYISIWTSLDQMLARKLIQRQTIDFLFHYSIDDDGIAEFAKMDLNNPTHLPHPVQKGLTWNS